MTEVAQKLRIRDYTARPLCGRTTFYDFFYVVVDFSNPVVVVVHGYDHEQRPECAEETTLENR